MCPTPARRAWRGSAPVMAWPQTRTCAGCDVPQAGHGLDELALPVAVDARERDDLAGAHLQRDAVDGGQVAVVEHVQVGDLERHVAGLALLLLDAQDDVAPDHHAREHRLVGAGGVDRPDALAAAQHRDAVGDLQHLGQLVGDEDDGRAARLQLSEDAHELARLLRGQHGRRLVEHEHPRAAVQRPEDLDALLHAHGDVLDAGVRVDLQPVALGELLGPPPRRLDVEEPAAARLVAEDQVLGDGHDRDEHEVLEHHADPVGHRVARRADRDQLAVDADLALVRVSASRRRRSSTSTCPRRSHPAARAPPRAGASGRSRRWPSGSRTAW